METAALVSLGLSTLLTLAGGLGAFILNNMKEALKAQQERTAALEKALFEQAQKTAETYSRREDFHRQSDAILDRLKGIENKLDRVIERMGDKA